MTEVQRDGSGAATALVAPFGQTTTLTVDTAGYLASVANPASEAYSFTYDSGVVVQRPFHDER